MLIYKDLFLYLSTVPILEIWLKYVTSEIYAAFEVLALGSV